MIVQRISTALLLLGLAACGAEERPIDVLFISLDSVRQQSLDFRDPETSPNLVRLAQRGTIFNQAISGSSWTLPAHAQMFTSTPPSLHGVLLDDVRIDPLTPTLPELVQAQGWFTAGFWTAWYLAADYGFGRGFAEYQNCMSGGEAYERRWREAVRAEDQGAFKAVLEEREFLGHRDVNSLTVVQRASAVASALTADTPLFLFTHFFDPHYDYLPPAPWDTAFDPDYSGSYDGVDFYHNTRIWDPDARPRRRIPDRDLEHILALYRGEIAWTDEAIGLLLDELQAAGRLENTLIVVTADHGDEFFEHQGRGHRSTLYDELIRVPLLIVPPGGRAAGSPAEVDAQVSLSDLMPTVLDYCGIESPPTALGRSLRPALEGAAIESRPVISSLVLSTWDTELKGWRYWLMDSLRTPEQKLVRYLDLAPHAVPRLSRVELFDLTADGAEQAPLTEQTHPAVRRAWRELEAELERLRSAYLDHPRSARDERGTGIREMFVAELADLGYAGAEDDPDALSTAGLSLPWPPGPPPPLEAPAAEDP